jgi:hypothetical protein
VAVALVYHGFVPSLRPLRKILEEDGGESTLLARGLELSNLMAHLKRHMAHERSKVRRISPRHRLILTCTKIPNEIGTGVPPILHRGPSKIQELQQDP